MRYVIRLDGHLPRKNQCRGRHWAKEHALKQQLAGALMVHRFADRIPVALGPRRVSLHVVLEPRDGQPDQDAYESILLDALVRAGLLGDDGPRGLYGHLVTTFERGEKAASIITLEDVEP